MVFFTTMMIFTFQDEIEKGIEVLKTQLSQKLREENLPVEQQKRFIAILVQVSRIELMLRSLLLIASLIGSNSTTLYEQIFHQSPFTKKFDALAPKSCALLFFNNIVKFGPKNLDIIKAKSSF